MAKTFSENGTPTILTVKLLKPVISLNTSLSLTSFLIVLRPVVKLVRFLPKQSA